MEDDKEFIYRVRGYPRDANGALEHGGFRLRSFVFLD